MRWKEIVRDYLTFSRKESIAVVVLLVVLSLIIISPIFFSPKNRNNSISPDNSWIAAVKQLEETNTPPKDSDQTRHTYGYEYDRRENNYQPSSSILFFFDPNKISAEEWKRLGLRDKTIRTIQNYLSKGGQFKRKEDLQKIYGLRQNEYEKLEPYIQIPGESAEKKNEVSDKSNFPVINKSFVKAGHSPVEINIADTSAFISLPGIGSKLAARIVNFREKLGGFNSIEQIRETYGLPDSTYQKIKPHLKLDNVGIKKINLNTASIDALKLHPYIRYNIANAIIAYRNEHGSFSSIADLKKIMLITDDVYNKISPYLSTTN
ncbi:helix-hairpin-helix domain-containing protein [Terrimonas pollutisoli]|uniref:helix-hairpin-helix domain-containing protein n=1 Tax=Terrimonas pollutisoli TaxID=3034147 RepID=UPI0023ED2004|nr:helix-hairpin-helix domain-containing protein [Terrimonas sp. H1YJ31]